MNLSTDIMVRLVMVMNRQGNFSRPGMVEEPGPFVRDVTFTVVFGVCDSVIIIDDITVDTKAMNHTLNIECGRMHCPLTT
jgi:hypothetical protein